MVTAEIQRWFRAKVTAKDSDTLLRAGFGVNRHNCKDNEYWVIGLNARDLEQAIAHHQLKALTEVREF